MSDAGVAKRKRVALVAHARDGALRAPVKMPYCVLCRLPRKDRTVVASMLFRRVPIADIAERFNTNTKVVSLHSTRCIPVLMERIVQSEMQSDVSLIERLLLREGQAMGALVDQMRDAAKNRDITGALQIAKELMVRVDDRALWIERMQANRDRQSAEVIRMLAAQLVLRAPIEGARIVSDALNGHPALENLMNELEEQNECDDTD